MLVESLGWPTCNLKAEPSKLDNKRREPGNDIDSLFKLAIVTLLSIFVSI